MTIYCFLKLERTGLPESKRNNIELWRKLLKIRIWSNGTAIAT